MNIGGQDIARQQSRTGIANLLRMASGQKATQDLTKRGQDITVRGQDINAVRVANALKTTKLQEARDKAAKAKDKIAARKAEQEITRLETENNLIEKYADAPIESIPATARAVIGINSNTMGTKKGETDANKRLRFKDMTKALLTMEGEYKTDFSEGDALRDNYFELSGPEATRIPYWDTRFTNEWKIVDLPSIDGQPMTLSRVRSEAKKSGKSFDEFMQEMIESLETLGFNFED